MRSSGRLGQARKELQAPAYERRGLLIRRSSRSILDGLLEVRDSLFVIAALLEMHGERGGDLVDVVAAQRFDRIADSGMKMRTPRRRYPAVHDVPIERMLEAITR